MTKTSVFVLSMYDSVDKQIANLKQVAARHELVTVQIADSHEHAEGLRALWFVKVLIQSEDDRAIQALKRELLNEVGVYKLCPECDKKLKLTEEDAARLSLRS